MTATGVTAPSIQLNRNLPRPSRPNYNKTHARPLPLVTHPLPPLIPNNPLSLIHIAITFISQLVLSPSSHPKAIYVAYWSPETSSVHVTDDAAVRALWECGFFGKGSLSRSEPSWLEREKRRLGLLAVDTSEELTQQRREDRKRFKKERAKKEREAIEEKLREEKTAKIDGRNLPQLTARAEHEGLQAKAISTAAESIESLVALQPAEPLSPVPLLSAEPKSIIVEDKSPIQADFTKHKDSLGSAFKTLAVSPEDKKSSEILENQEHLQLTLTEVFFLTYALGILTVYSPITNTPLSTSELFTLFISHSTFPPTSISHSLQPSIPAPDSPFLLNYTTYHHFRSLGHVVRPGLKFGIDYLLYARGPVFSHAEFGVIVLPAYVDPYWRATDERMRNVRKKRDEGMAMDERESEGIGTSKENIGCGMGGSTWTRQTRGIVWQEKRKAWLCS